MIDENESINEVRVEKILKDIADIFVKHNIDYATVIGITMVVLRAGMLGMNIKPEEGYELFAEAAKLYAETYEEIAEASPCGDESCGHCNASCETNVDTNSQDKSLGTWFNLN